MLVISSASFQIIRCIVMAGLDPAIHVFFEQSEERRGCPAQGRA
jgi:hypothetical protein